MLYEGESTRRFNESTLHEFFSKTGMQYEQEKTLIFAIIQTMASAQTPITNKSIILYMLNVMKSTPDMMHLELLRSTLDIIVSLTPDDFIF